MSSLKKFDYRIKDNRKRNIFISLIILVTITIIGVKLYQSKAEFKVETNNIDMVSGKVTIPATHYLKLLEKTNKDQLVYDGTVDNNLRYVGVDPENYVKVADQLWRIIGVMNNVKGGTNASDIGETRIKLIRAESLGQFSWDYKQSGVGSSTTNYGSNDWTDSQLMMMLNPKEVIEKNWKNQPNKTSYTIDNNGTPTDGTTVFYKGIGSYFDKKAGYKPNNVETNIQFNKAQTDIDFTNTGLPEELKELIDTAEYYLGRPLTTKANVKTSYDGERNGNTYNKNPKIWLGYIGLMYPSDYGYATSGGSKEEEKKDRDE